nr:hypothetical protein [Bradyrhizobium sp. sGM-13]
MPRVGDLRIDGNIKFDFAGHLYDGLWMMAILEQRVFESLGAVHEQAAIPLCSRATQLPR